MAAGTKVGEAYVELQARMAKFESQLRSAEVMTGKSVSKMQAKFQTLAPTFKKVGIGMAVAGGAITGALAFAVKGSISFNKEMANIATLIPGATERVIELKGAIRTMAVDVGKSTADLAQGGYQVISAFGDTADTVAILEMSAKAATAGVATTTESINLLSAVTKGYGDISKEAVKKASDLAFQTVTLGQTTFPELAASIGRVIPLAAEMGVKEEELFAVMATGTGVTGKAAEVSTQLRGAIQSLMAPTADMIILLEKEGYTSGKAMLADLGLAGALELIKKRADESNTPLQKYISSIEGQTIALALTGTQADNYTKKLAAMRDATGLTDIAFKEQTEGINKAGFAFEQAKIRIGVLGQEIGDRLLPMITPLIEKITAMVKKMSDWAKEHPGLSSGIVKVAAVLGPLLIGLGGLLVVLPGLVTLAPAVGAAFHIMLGPIGLITAAIATAVAAFLYFYKTNEKFAAFVNKIGGAIKKFVKDSWDRLLWFIKNWGQVWETASQIVRETVLFVGKVIWKVLTNKEAFIAFIKLWGTLYTSVGRIITDTMVFIGKVIARASSIIWAPIWESLKWIADQFRYYFGVAGNAIRNAIETAVNWVTSKFVSMVNFITQKVINPIIAGFEVFANTILGSIGWVVEKVISLFSTLPNFILKAFGTSKEEVKEFATEIREKFEVELGRIPEIAEDALTIKIPQKTLQEPKKFSDRMSEAWETIKAQYAAIPGDLTIYLEQLGAEWDTITAAAGEFGEAVDFAEYAGKIGTLITKLKEAGVDTTALEEAAKGAGKAIDSITTATEKYITTFDSLQKLTKKATGTSKEQNEELEKLQKRLKELRGEEYIRALENMIKRAQEQKERTEEQEAALKALQEQLKATRGEEYIRAIQNMILRQIEQMERTEEQEVALVALAERLKTLRGTEYIRGLENMITRQIEQKERAEEQKEALEELEQQLKKLRGEEYIRALENMIKRAIEQKDRTEEQEKALEKLKKELKELRGREYIRALENMIKRQIEQKERTEEQEEALRKLEEQLKEVKGQEYIRAIQNMILRQIEQMERTEEQEVALKALEERLKKLRGEEYIRALENMITRQIEQKERTEEQELALKELEERLKKLRGDEYIRALQNMIQIQINQKEKTEEQEAALKALQEQVEKTFRKKVIETWGSAFEAIARAARDSIVDVINGARSIGEAFINFGQILQTQVADAFWDLAVAAVKAGEMAQAAWLGAVSVIISAFNALAKGFFDAIFGIEEASERVQTAWGDFFESWEIGGRKMTDYLKDLANRFSEIGLAISDTVEASQRKLEGLYKSIEDLGKNTREKLIDELDKYYIYQELEIMSLDELLALSAESRLKLEKGTLEEVANTAEETAEREKDAKISVLQQIEENYKTEMDLMNQRILLTKIEIKLLELQMTDWVTGGRKRIEIRRELNDLLDEYDEKYTEVRETTEDVTEATEDATKATKEYGREGKRSADDVRDAFGRTRRQIEDTGTAEREAAKEAWAYGEEGRKAGDKLYQSFKEMTKEIREAIEASGGFRVDIGKIPSQIDFDIIGNLHMPEIRAPGDIYFDIWGRYRPPEIPGAQIGIPYIPRTEPYVVHKKEAILNPRQAEEWRAGRAGRAGREGESKVIERRTIEQNITIQSLFPPDDPVLWDRIWREGLRAAAERESGRRIG